MTRPRELSMTASPRRKHLHPADEAQVRDIMSHEVVTVRDDVSLPSLAALLLERGVSRVPVVDAEQRLVGMVAMTDLVVDAHLRGDTDELRDDAPAIPAGAGISYVPPGFHVEDTGKLVGEVMNRGVISVRPEASIAEAAHLLTSHHLHGLPVADGLGALVGFVSSSDIVAWVATTRVR
jgi:CBS domain-containing protein